MKKASRIETKTASAKKAGVKATVKKTSSAVAPKLSANHNETFLTR
jgi:hypothetical protein